MPQENEKKLFLTFHGRVLEHLGIQMYQSPVAAIAELIANSWDADAEKVKISLPTTLDKSAIIKIEDDGNGMTFSMCQNKYLNVGWNRRGDNPDEKSSRFHRYVLGRKGIGKFAGFGIAKIIEVETISIDNGEKTRFELNLETLRGEKYVSTESKSIEVIDYQPPNETNRNMHGTKVLLKNLTIKRKPNSEQFRASMARRFLLHDNPNFNILVDDQSLPGEIFPSDVEFVFPRDYKDNEKPIALSHIDNKTGWGSETLNDGKTIRWRVLFLKDPLGIEEMKGVSVFAKCKLVQTPFCFNLIGGLHGQHGLEYLSGQVVADFIDSMQEDLIATERQRINWDNETTTVLLQWGAQRIKDLIGLWQDRRSEKRKREVEQKISHFESRLSRFSSSERKTIERALLNICHVPQLNESDLIEMGNAVLTAWEQGRLKDLITSIAEIGSMTTDVFIKILTETKVLTALNLAEAVKTKLQAIKKLEDFVNNKELENELRDFLGKNPWLLDPKWESFKKEIRVNHILKSAAKKSGLDKDEYKGRIDLALISGEQLLVVELMRPGLSLDLDHLGRCQTYVDTIDTQVKSETGLDIKSVSGLIVADKKKADDAVIYKRIEDLRDLHILVFTWSSLIGNARKAWSEYIEILVDRAPEEPRLQSLREHANG